MILQNEDIASTSNKGIVETATDAEVVARTDTSRYVTPASIGVITQTTVLQTTRQINAAD
jgi:hypothetical protein